MSLKDFYNRVYSGDKAQYFVKYRHGATASESHRLVGKWLQQHAPDCARLLDFGCGEGELLGAFVPANVERVGIDYSEVALEHARRRYPDVEFVLGSEERLAELAGQFDVVVSCGTIEHVEDPKRVIGKLANCLRPAGSLILSCPNFVNVRGVVWMTLSKLFDVPMSLSDRHFIGPADLGRWSNELSMRVIAMQAVDLEVGQGDYTCVDLKKRLTNALRDAGMDNSKVDRLLDWLTENLGYFPVGELSGSECLYLLRV